MYSDRNRLLFDAHKHVYIYSCIYRDDFVDESEREKRWFKQVNIFGGEGMTIIIIIKIIIIMIIVSMVIKYCIKQHKLVALFVD